MSESRKYDRVPCRLRCRCEADHLTVFARVGNLSEGGLFLRTSTPFERGTPARIQMALTRSDAGEEALVEATAMVRWSRVEGQGGPPGMGLKFEGLDARARGEIRRLLGRERGF